ncbi:MAG: response regulator [Rhodocyclaceae bacterium]|nr:response regulator [Rhodocyclaceae bacterium]MCB1961751.1 response regulator [Rhodocyclaceae bacterium]
MAKLPRLLVVDDMDSVRALVAAIARECGFDVAQASNGKQALTQCQAAPGGFAAIVCDWNMPQMNGEEFVNALRQDDKTTPVIMLTAERDREKLMALIDMGINGYILKPFKPADLLKALSQVAAKVGARAPAA